VRWDLAFLQLRKVIDGWQRQKYFSEGQIKMIKEVRPYASTIISVCIKLEALAIA
jgi:hypothetical protein